MGYITKDEIQWQAVEWTNGQASFLDSNPIRSSWAFGVNDQGYIAGAIGDPSGDTARPVIWHDNTVAYIPLPDGATSGTAIAINNSGQVLVSYNLVDSDVSLTSYYLWNHGTEVLLQQFSDPIFGTYAISMNDSGAVVGTSANRAVCWQDGQIYDLNNLIVPNSGWVLIEANSINDAGDIVGLGQYDGVDTPFFLTPGGGITSIPEPAAISLIAGLGILLRRARCGWLCPCNQSAGEVGA